MPSLRELQTRFANGLLHAEGDSDERMGIYRNTVFTNYRHALSATFPVVRQLVGLPFFRAAADAYAEAFPSTSGDLNVYGDRFGDFLDAYPHAAGLAYLPDVARLEWAIDEASRAADVRGAPEAILAELATIPVERITAQRFVLDPSCRFVDSDYPLLRIWQVHQPGIDGDIAVPFDRAGDRLLVRREMGAASIERLASGDFALLRALAAGEDVAAALDVAMEADATFDLGTTLRTCIANRTLMELRAD